MAYHDQRTSEQLKELAMQFLQRESNHTSLVTVTNIRFESRNNIATILVTVLPEDKEKPVIDFLKRKRTDFRNYVKEHARLRAIPTFDFDIDLGEKNRQKIDVLTS